MTREELRQLAEEISAKNTVVAQIFRNAAVEGESNVYNLKGADLDDVKAKMAEVEDLSRKYELGELKARTDERERWITSPAFIGQYPAGATGGDGAAALPFKTYGDNFTDSPEFAACKGQFVGKSFAVEIPGTLSRRQISLNRQVHELKSMGADLDAIKATMTLAAGFAPANDRTDLIVAAPSLDPTLADRIPSRDTELETVFWMLQTTRTNNVAPTAEAAALPEVAIAYTEQSSTMRLVGGILPISEQQLADVPMVQSLVNDDLMLMYRQKEENLLLNGDGVSPNIKGFLEHTNINAQARGGDPIFDCIHKGITKIEVTGRARADLVVMHPNDYERIRLTKTNDGIYIYGSPVEAGPTKIWGLDIHKTTEIAEGTALPGAYKMYSQIWRRQGVIVELGYNNDDWGKLKRTFRVYGRMVLIVKRETAFTECTGLNT